MDTRIILIYCMCDDLLKALNHREDPQCRLCDAEIMTIAIVAALYFGGNYALSHQSRGQQDSYVDFRSHAAFLIARKV